MQRVPLEVFHDEHDQREKIGFELRPGVFQLAVDDSVKGRSDSQQGQECLEKALMRGRPAGVVSHFEPEAQVGFLDLVENGEQPVQHPPEFRVQSLRRLDSAG